MDSTTPSTPPTYPTHPAPPALPFRRTARSSEPIRPTGRSSGNGKPGAPPSRTPGAAPVFGHPVPIDPVAARRAPRDLRRVWRVVVAVLLPLGPLFVAVAFALRPFTLDDEPTVIVAKIL